MKKIIDNDIKKNFSDSLSSNIYFVKKPTISSMERS